MLARWPTHAETIAYIRAFIEIKRNKLLNESRTFALVSVKNVDYREESRAPLHNLSAVCPFEICLVGTTPTTARARGLCCLHFVT